MVDWALSRMLLGTGRGDTAVQFLLLNLDTDTSRYFFDQKSL